MADGARLRKLEERIRRSESQIVEFQHFVETSKVFMSTTQSFMEESRAKHEENTRLIENQGKKTDQQYSELTDLISSLFRKDSPPVEEVQSRSALDRGILDAGAAVRVREQGDGSTRGNWPGKQGNSSNSWSMDSRGCIVRTLKLEEPVEDLIQELVTNKVVGVSEETTTQAQLFQEIDFAINNPQIDDDSNEIEVAQACWKFSCFYFVAYYNSGW